MNQPINRYEQILHYGNDKYEIIYNYAREDLTGLSVEEVMIFANWAQKEIKREFAEFMGGGFADGVNSGTNAVYVALRAVEPEPFTEVIVLLGAGHVDERQHRDRGPLAISARRQARLDSRFQLDG